MSDLFHEAVPDDFIDQVFAVMCWARHHTFLVLTKRPERMRAYMQSRVRREWVPPAGTVPPHVWLGVSVEDQATADARIPVLLETPAAVRWVSAEPLLGPIDLIAWVSPSPGGLYWVVIGGESGPFARPFDLAWARDISAQCAAAGVPVFVKQLGAKPVDSDYLAGRAAPEDRRSIERATALGRPLDCQPNLVLLNDRKGGDMAEFPRELQVREYPA
jgi:protein gp37